ncbi:MAG TPA: hypothetical protein VKZ92_04440, partial [Pseudohongiella sp.]|nr:hypothetical protein [Pseudohongiella sp.]
EADDSDDDTVMIISTPNTDWLCDDDSYTALNPLIEISNPEEGQYDIWVGTYESGEFVGGTLRISEMPATR